MRYYSKTNLKAAGDRLIRKGEVLPEGLFSEADIQKMLRKGSIDVAPTEPAAPPKPSEPTAGNHGGLWAFDPRSLQGQKLEILNMMIAQHIHQKGLAQVDPFEDAAEAIAFLTQDFKG